MASHLAQRQIGQPPPQKRQRQPNHNQNGHSGYSHHTRGGPTGNPPNTAPPGLPNANRRSPYGQTQGHHPPSRPQSAQRPNAQQRPPQRSQHLQSQQRQQPQGQGHQQRAQQQQQQRAQQQRAQQQQQQQRVEFHRLMEIQQVSFIEPAVQKWIYEQCALSDNIEIEAKLGKLVTFHQPDPMDGEPMVEGHEIRLHEKLGITSCAMVDLKKSGGRFESTVTIEVFQRLNALLNNWYSNCNSPPQNRIEELRKLPFPRMLYQRNRTVDKIYQQDGDFKNAVRVTYDMKDPTRIKEVIEKKKKSSINICYPKSKWDIRMSASIENVVPKPMGQMVTSVRCKDRISYQYDYFSIDITSTYTYSDGLTPQKIQEVMERFGQQQQMPGGSQRTFEVELEIVDQKHLAKIRKSAAEKREHAPLMHLAYFFTQSAIKLSEISTNLRFTPMVCKVPARKK